MRDEDGWFENTFVTGPGFQMAQKFVENIFEKHIDWIALIQNDDNYKNILQVKIQKEFKVTPHYIEIEYDSDLGYKMGVYLCLGQSIHTLNIIDAIHINDVLHKLDDPVKEVEIFKNIQEYINLHDGKIFMFLGEGHHKIKRKAEQIACNMIISLFN